VVVPSPSCSTSRTCPPPDWSWRSARRSDWEPVCGSSSCAPQSPQLLAEEQICLDERLLQWGRNEQVGVVGEVSLDEPASTARRVIGSSSFVVMSRSAVELLAGVDLPCPVAVVPGFEKG
jgi:hypothetical protein